MAAPANGNPHTTGLENLRHRVGTMTAGVGLKNVTLLAAHIEAAEAALPMDTSAQVRARIRLNQGNCLATALVPTIEDVHGRNAMVRIKHGPARTAAELPFAFAGELIHRNKHLVSAAVHKTLRSIQRSKRTEHPEHLLTFLKVVVMGLVYDQAGPLTPDALSRLYRKSLGVGAEMQYQMFYMQDGNDWNSCGTDIMAAAEWLRQVGVSAGPSAVGAVSDRSPAEYDVAADAEQPDDDDDETGVEAAADGRVALRHAGARALYRLMRTALRVEEATSHLSAAADDVAPVLLAIDTACSADDHKHDETSDTVPDALLTISGGPPPPPKTLRKVVGSAPFPRGLELDPSAACEICGEPGHGRSACPRLTGPNGERLTPYCIGCGRHHHTVYGCRSLRSALYAKSVSVEPPAPCILCGGDHTLGSCTTRMPSN